MAFIQWLQDHMLPCPFKYFTGLDCPGCGFQRSVLALLQGNLGKSLQLYPPAIPLLIFFAYGIAGIFFQLDTKNEWIKKTGFLITGTIVALSYFLKLYGIYQGHTTSI